MFSKKLLSIFNIIPFKQGDVFLRKNTVHSFENALLGGCHFSRVARICLMSVARFSWVPNLYNIHFLVENHRPQPDPVNCHGVALYIPFYTRSQCFLLLWHGSHVECPGGVQDCAQNLVARVDKTWRQLSSQWLGFSGIAHKGDMGY